MTLLELAKQYKADVETRIECIKDERNTLDPIDLAPYHQEAIDDCNEQIAHWEATLRIIRKIIKENS